MKDSRSCRSDFRLVDSTLRLKQKKTCGLCFILVVLCCYGTVLTTLCTLVWSILSVKWAASLKVEETKTFSITKMKYPNQPSHHHSCSQTVESQISIYFYNYEAFSLSYYLINNVSNPSIHTEMQTACSQKLTVRTSLRLWCHSY